MTNRSSSPIATGSKSTILASVLMSAVVSVAATGCGEARSNGGSAAAVKDAHNHGAESTTQHAGHGGHDNSDGHHSAGAHTHTTRLEFTSDPGAITPGAPATWRLRIVDAKTGAPVPEFDESHEKLMHLIVVSKELGWFNHLHPQYQGNGEFTIDAVLPRAGEYKLYADYTPKGASQEVAQHEFATTGAPPTTSSLTAADQVGAGGWMVRSTVSRPEGEPEARGSGNYQVAMMPMPSKIKAGKDVMLHFQVRNEKGEPLTDLEPYLGALGHAVLLSGDTKTYLHTHPMGGEMEGMDHGSGGHEHHAAPAGGSSDVIFHTNFPTAGLYKVWGQFQHKGKIITAAFVLQVT